MLAIKHKQTNKIKQETSLIIHFPIKKTSHSQRDGKMPRDIDICCPELHLPKGYMVAKTEQEMNGEWRMENRK